MSRVITAIYENGVFKPLEKVSLKEHEKVEIKVLSQDEWQKRFARIIENIQKKTVLYPSEEIESDVAMALKETREAKRGC